jgi:hypothetical protein
MVLFADTGELVLHDHDGPGFTQSRLARALGRRGALGMPPAPVRRTLSRRYGDDVVVLDIETGAEKARARVPSLFQSVLFPAAGRSRDVYWCTFSTLARLRVTPADGRGPVARSS